VTGSGTSVASVKYNCHLAMKGRVKIQKDEQTLC
jgi:hypothetical protein